MLQVVGKRIVAVLAALALMALAGCGGGGSVGSGAPKSDQPAAKSDQPAVKSDQQAAKPAQKITLKAVTALPEKVPDNSGFWILVENIQKQLGDRLEIKYLGGPDVVPSFEIGEAIRNGTVDIAATPMNYYAPQMPEAEALNMSQITPMEARKRGAVDYFDKLHAEKLNAKYLGELDGLTTFHFYTKFKVNGLADFKGKTFRVSPTYVQLMGVLGAGQVTLPPGEIYTALERGVVDGFGWSGLSITNMGWHEVSKYRIDPGFYNPDVVLVMNLNAWKKLPADLQKDLIRVVTETEQQAHDHHQQLIKDQTAEIQKKGMQILTLPPAEADTYVKTAYDAKWKYIIGKSPEHGPKLRTLLSK